MRTWIMRHRWTLMLWAVFLVMLPIGVWLNVLFIRWAAG